MDEQRRTSRNNSQVMVELSHPGFGVAQFKTKDLSDGGTFVFLGNQIAPPIGAVVRARFKRSYGVINEDAVDMQVVHHLAGGFGLMFL